MTAARWGAARSGRGRAPAPHDWARTRVGEWLAAGPPILVLTGASGAGKSNFVDSLRTAASGFGYRTHAMHRCEARGLSSMDPVRVVAALAHQLARTLPGYETLGRLTQTGPSRGPDLPPPWTAALDSLTPELAYNDALLSRLRVLASAGRITGRDYW